MKNLEIKKPSCGGIKNPQIDICGFLLIDKFEFIIEFVFTKE